MAQTINMGVTEEKAKSFFEVRIIKEGAQFLAVRGDTEVSGLIHTRNRSVVEAVVGRVFTTKAALPPEVATAADKLVAYAETMLNQFSTDYVTVGATIKSGGVKVTLHLYLTYYSDDNVEEWRGQVDVSVEGRVGKKVMGGLMVKKRVVSRKKVSGYQLYMALTEAARHALAAIVEE
jgi:hypothetical protein